MSETEDGARMCDFAPARLLRGLVEQTLHWYLPESQRLRFLRIGEDYSYLDSHRWEAAYQMARVKLGPCLKTMGTWSNRPETDALLCSWDDETFFFYVLRFQFVWIRLYAIGDEVMIPYGLDEFWEWAMTIKEGETWIYYTFPTVVEYNKLDPKPPIWRFFSPCDVPITKNG
jgi:hypothetical protein